MNITVILCTFNRGQRLAEALTSLADSIVPDSDDWEVLVVDNGSTDQTRQLVENLCVRYPRRFRYVFEGRGGKSYALNTGIREARGEFLAFLDDDVTVDRAWLASLTAPLRDGQWAGSGGRIILGWPDKLPRWLATKGPYARTPFPDFDEGPSPKPLTTPPFGTNMAFCRSVFERYGYFRTDLGPGPNASVPRPGEDTEFGQRLLSAGERLWYEPSAVVHHPIVQSRINKKYFLDWWFDAGRSGIRAFGVRAGTKWFVAGVPLHMIRSLGLWTFRWIFSVKPQARFYYRIVVWSKLGSITECYRQFRAGVSAKADKTETASA